MGWLFKGRLEPARRIRSPISFVTCLRLAVGSLLFPTVKLRLALSGISFPKACVISTISVTTSEREGLKQVEKAIGLMLGIVNVVDGNHQRQRGLIRDLETRIVANRKRLAEIDAQIAAIATTHLSRVPGGTETPYEAAKRVIADRPAYEWFTDRPDRPFADTGIDETTIAALSAARKRVGADLQFLNERLPSPANLPDPATLLEWHRDLVAANSLSDKIAHSEPLLRRVLRGLVWVRPKNSRFR